MQDIYQSPYLADMAEGDVTDMLNGMRGVVDSFDNSCLFLLLEM